jgi:hypothetical protein
MPPAQMPAVGVEEREQVPGVLAINQPQFGLVVNFVEEHLFCQRDPVET